MPEVSCPRLAVPLPNPFPFPSLASWSRLSRSFRKIGLICLLHSARPQTVTPNPESATIQEHFMVRRAGARARRVCRAHRYQHFIWHKIE